MPPSCVQLGNGAVSAALPIWLSGNFMILLIVNPMTSSWLIYWELESIWKFGSDEIIVNNHRYSVMPVPFMTMRQRVECVLQKPGKDKVNTRWWYLDNSDIIRTDDSQNVYCPPKKKFTLYEKHFIALIECSYGLLQGAETVSLICFLNFRKIALLISITFYSPFVSAQLVVNLQTQAWQLYQ